MGRHAKYFNQVEKTKATRNRKAHVNTERYAAQITTACVGKFLTLICSEKVLRCAQNQHAYEKCKRSPETNLVAPLSNIPQSLHIMSQSTFPILKPLFRQEFHRWDEITQDGHLAHWDNFPPYHSSSLLTTYGMSGFLELIQGQRFRAQYQYEELQLVHYKTTSEPVFLQEIHAEITKWVLEWLELKSLLKTASLAGVDLKMGRSLLEWKACRVMDFLADWKAVKKGRDSDQFMILYTNRW